MKIFSLKSNPLVVSLKIQPKKTLILVLSPSNLSNPFKIDPKNEFLDFHVGDESSKKGNFYIQVATTSHQFFLDKACFCSSFFISTSTA